MAGKYDRFGRMLKSMEPEEKEQLLARLLTDVPVEELRNSRKKRTEMVDIGEYIEEAKKIRELSRSNEIQGLSTGIKSMDDLMLGMTPGELIVVSGPTSCGKTQLTTHIAYNVARAGHKVLFVTMEMTHPQMTERFMGAAKPDDENLEAIRGKVKYQKEYDLPSTDIQYLVSNAVKEGVELVVIDHLHYFAGGNDDNRAQEIGDIVKDFKQAAVTYEIPVILITHIRKLQSNRAKPTGNDLRDSSLIGQHADQIIMVWRDTSPDAKEPNKVEVSNWKNRQRGLHDGKRLRYFTSTGAKLVEGEPKEKSDRATAPAPWQSKDTEISAEEIEDIFG